VEGFVIFVVRAKVGQKVKIKIDQVGSKHATATLIGEARRAEK
jgi:predicted RNA-binding protein with TRAM domain